MKKRIISFLLACTMIFSLCPPVVAVDGAAESTTVAGEQEENQIFGATQSPEQLSENKQDEEELTIIPVQEQNPEQANLGDSTPETSDSTKEPEEIALVTDNQEAVSDGTPAAENTAENTAANTQETVQRKAAPATSSAHSADEIKIELSSDSPVAGQDYEVRISAPGANQIRFYNPADAEEPEHTEDNDEYAFTTSFSAGSYSFSASASFGGVWTDKCEAFEFTVAEEVKKADVTTETKIEEKPVIAETETFALSSAPALTKGNESHSADDVSITVSSDDIWAGEPFIFTINAPGASKIKLLQAGGYEMSSWEGDSAEYYTALSNAGEASFYASALFDEEWIDSNAITINVQAKGTLDAVQATVPASVTAGETLSISWSPVENATRYSYYLYRPDVASNGISSSFSDNPLTISTDGLEEGTYNLNLSAHGSGWASSNKTYSFVIEGANAPAAPVVTAESTTVKINSAPKFYISTSGSDQIRFIVTFPYGYTMPATEATVWGDPAEFQGIILGTVGEHTFRFSVNIDGTWSSYSDPITITCVSDGELKTPDFTIPAQITVGTDLALTMTATEDADWYSEHTGNYQLVINDADGNYVDSKFLYFNEISDISTLTFSGIGLETGDYQASLWINAEGYETKKSEYKSFSVVGEAAAAPTVTTDKEQYHTEAVVKFTVIAPGAESIAYFYENSSSSTVVPATGDTTVIELPASTLLRNYICFAAYVNGAWSAWTDWIGVCVLDMMLAQPQVTVPESITAGKDLNFTVGSVEHADRIVVSVVQHISDDGYDESRYTNWVGDYAYLIIGDSGNRLIKVFNMADGTTSCTIDGNRFVIGTYRLRVVARDTTDTYADSDIQEIVFRVTDSGLTPPTLSSDKNEVWVDEPYIELIAATETGTKVEFYITQPSGYTFSKEASVTYGTAVYNYASTTQPGTVSVKARVWDGEFWSDYCEPLEFEVRSLGKLETPSADIPESITAGKDYTFEINAEDAAEKFWVTLYRTADNLDDEPVPYNVYITEFSGSKSVTIPAMHLTEGQYQLRITVGATHFQDSDSFEVFFKAVGSAQVPALTLTADRYTIKTCEAVTFTVTPSNFTVEQADVTIFEVIGNGGIIHATVPLIDGEPNTFTYDKWISSGEHTLYAEYDDIRSEPITVTVTSHGKLATPTVEAISVQSTEDSKSVLKISTEDPPRRVNGFLVTLTAVNNSADVVERDLPYSEDGSYTIGWNRAGLYNVTAKAYGTDYEPSDDAEKIQVLFVGYALHMIGVVTADGEINHIYVPIVSDLNFGLSIAGDDSTGSDPDNPLIIPVNTTKTFNILEDPIILPEGNSRKVSLLLASIDDPDNAEELAVEEAFKGETNLDAYFGEMGDFIMYAVDLIDENAVSITRKWYIKVIGPLLTADKDEAWTCEKITFTVEHDVTSGTVYLYADDMEEPFAEAGLSNGKATISYSFKQKGVRRIVAKTGEHTSGELELVIKSLGKLDAPEVVYKRKQVEPRGITLSWAPVDHADGYVVYIRNEEFGTFYKHDFAKTSLETDEEGRFVLNFPASELKGIGDYEFSIWDYGYQYDQNGTNWLPVTLIPNRDGPSFTMSPTEIQGGLEYTTLTVTDNEATEVAYYVIYPGQDDFVYRNAHTLTDGSVEIHASFWTGGIYTIAFMAKYDDEWSNLGPSQELTVKATDDIDVSQYSGNVGISGDAVQVIGPEPGGTDGVIIPMEYIVYVNEPVTLTISGNAHETVNICLNDVVIGTQPFADGYATMSYTFTELGTFTIYGDLLDNGVSAGHTLEKIVHVIEREQTEITLSANKTEAWTCEQIIFTVEFSKGTGTVYLYADGMEEPFAEAELSNGKATIPYDFKQAGIRRIVAKIGEVTSTALELEIKCIEKLKAPEINCAAEQPEPQGITLSWAPVDHADGYMVYVRNEEDGIFYKHDYKKTALEKDENGNYILNIPSSQLKGEGNYQVSVWDYGYQYDQNGTEWVSVALVKPVLSAIITPEIPEGNEKQDISFTVTVNTTECTAIIRDPSGSEIPPSSSSVADGKRTFNFKVRHETDDVYNYTLLCYGTGSMASAGKLEKGFQIVVNDTNKPVIKTASAEPTTVWVGNAFTLTVTANKFTEKLNVYEMINGEEVLLTSLTSYAVWDDSSRSFVYDVTAATSAGTRAFSFIPVNADDQKGESYPLTVTIKDVNELPAPIFSNIVEGDIVVDPSFTVEWYAPDLPAGIELKEYCFDFYRWDDDTDWWTAIDHYPNIGLEQEYTLHDMIVGKPYRVEVYGITTGGLKTKVAVVNFSYKTIPAFSLNENETVFPTVKGGKAVVTWNAPIWPGHPEMKPTGYIVRLFGPGFSSAGEVVSGNGLSADATCLEIPGNYTIEAGNYAVEVYAYIKEGAEETFRVADGKNDFIIENPQISLKKPGNVCPYGQPIAVEGTVKGGISRIRLYIYDNAEKTWVALTGAKNNENYVVCSVDEDGKFSIDLTPATSLLESNGRYYLHTIGFYEEEGSLNQLAYPDAMPLKISTGEISSFTLYGYSQDGKNKDKYTGTWAYVGETTKAELKTDTIVVSAVVSGSDFSERNNTGRSDDGDVRTFSFESFSLSKEQRYDFTAKTSNGKTAKAFIYAVTKLTEQQGYVSLPEGQDTILVRSLPDGNGNNNNTSTLKNGDLVHIIGEFGDWWMLSINEKIRFINKDYIQTSNLELYIKIFYSGISTLHGDYFTNTVEAQDYSYRISNNYTNGSIWAITSNNIEALDLYVLDAISNEYIKIDTFNEFVENENGEREFSRALTINDFKSGRTDKDNNVEYSFLLVDASQLAVDHLSIWEAYDLINLGIARENMVWLLPKFDDNHKNDFTGVVWYRMVPGELPTKSLLLYNKDSDNYNNAYYVYFRYNNKEYIAVFNDSYEIKFTTYDELKKAQEYKERITNLGLPEWRIFIDGKKIKIQQISETEHSEYRLCIRYYDTQASSYQYIYSNSTFTPKTSDIVDLMERTSYFKTNIIDFYITKTTDTQKSLTAPLMKGQQYEFGVQFIQDERYYPEKEKVDYTYSYYYLDEGTKKKKYYDILNSYSEEDNPLYSNEFMSLFSDRLYSMGFSRELVNQIYHVVANAPAKYRNLYLYSLYDVNVLDAYYAGEKINGQTFDTTSYNYYQNGKIDGIVFLTEQMYTESIDNIEKITILFHEWGHAIDHMKNGDMTSKMKSQIYENIEKDVKAMIEQWVKAIVKENAYDVNLDKLVGVMQEYFMMSSYQRNPWSFTTITLRDPNTGTNVTTTLSDWEFQSRVQSIEHIIEDYWNCWYETSALSIDEFSDLVSNFGKNDIYDSILEVLSSEEWNSKKNSILVTDTLGGMTGNAITIGHEQFENGYWDNYFVYNYKDDGDNVGKLKYSHQGSESFAEFFASKICAYDSIADDVNDVFFHNTCTVLDKCCDELLAYYKKLHS